MTLFTFSPLINLSTSDFFYSSDIFYDNKNVFYKPSYVLVVT